MTTTPYGNFLSRQLGHPYMAGDSLAALAALADMDGLGGPIRNIFHRRGGGGGGGGGGQGRQFSPAQMAFLRQLCQGGGGGGGGAPSADDIEGVIGDWTDDTDIAELEGDELEGEELGEDDEDDGFGADEVGDMGAIGAIENKIERLERHIAKLEAKLASTPSWKRHKRHRIMKAIARAKKHIGRKKEKQHRRASRVAAALGLPVAAVTAGAAAGMIAPTQLAAMSRNASRAQALGKLYDVHGASPRTTPGGDEVPIPLNDTATGASVVNIAVAIGAGLRTAAVSMTSPIISFSEFEIIGLDINFTIRQDNVTPAGGTVPVQPNEIVTRLLANTLTPNGGINLFYATQDVAFGAQYVAYPGAQAFMRSIRGLRANPNLDKTNQVVFTATFRQEITTTTAINAAITAALITRPRNDSAALRAA